MDNLEQTNQKVNLDKACKKERQKLPKLYKILTATLLPLLLILAFVGGYFSRYIFSSDAVNTASDVVALIEKVGYVYDPVTGEERLLTEEEIADAIVLGTLDKYSAYYTEQELETVNQNASGRYSGIGISIEPSGEIFSVSFNSPAELAGIEKGDTLVSVSLDGAEPIFYNANDGADFLQALANANESQNLTIVLNKNGEKKTVNLKKSYYLSAYVKYVDSQKTLNFRDNGKGGLVGKESDGGMALEEDTAYIKFSQFYGGAAEQMKQALDYMQSRNRTKLILDLRDNGGGYLSVLQDIACYFIYDEGKAYNLVAYAEGKTGKMYTHTKKSAFYDNVSKIVVLANENTASASECLIGAMLHYKHCFDESTLVIEKNDLDGRARTYGKGIMQSTYQLAGGGALKLTTAKIYLPDKTTSIHGVGFIANADNAVEKGQSAIDKATEILKKA